MFSNDLHKDQLSSLTTQSSILVLFTNIFKNVSLKDLNGIKKKHQIPDMPYLKFKRKNKFQFSVKSKIIEE